MIRNLKALSLVLLATLAFSAVAASGASASSSIFDSSVANTILTGTSENNQVFSRGVFNVTCSHAQFEGTAEGATTSTVEIEADYTTGSCTGPLNSQVHVDFTTGVCGYRFTGTASKTAIAKLACQFPAGGQVTLTATNSDGSSLCTIHIFPLTFGGHVVFTNVQHNGIGSVTAAATVTGIASTRTGSSLCGPETHATGTYSGNSTFTGYEDNGGSKGKQVAIEVT